MINNINCTYSGVKPQNITLAMIRKGINLIKADMPDDIIEKIEISPKTKWVLERSINFRESTSLCNSLFGVPFSVIPGLKVPYRVVYLKPNERKFKMASGSTKPDYEGLLNEATS